MIEFTGERVIPGEVNADLWNEHFSRYAFAARFGRDSRTLDLGSGSGYGSAYLAQTATSVVAIDISAEAIAYASEHFRLDNLKYVPASATALPFLPQSFDRITAFEVIEHLADWRSLIAEARRVLKPDGILFVSTPNKLYYTESRGEQGPNPFHEHEFEASEFLAALHDVFPSVDLLLQNRTEAFAFHPYKTFRPVEAQIDSSRGNPDTANFFLAVCSPAYLPPTASFVYVPAVVNILREREHHISALQAELHLNQEWLATARTERDRSLAALEEVHLHLEHQNRWAVSLEADLNQARARILELQDDYRTEQQAAIAMARSYENKIEELEQANIEKTRWALDTEERLNREIEFERARLHEALTALQTSEATVQERTAWAHTLQAQLQQLEARQNLIRQSRWLKLGRLAGLGPRI